MKRVSKKLNVAANIQV